MGKIVDEIQSDANARDKRDIRGVEIDHSRMATCTRSHIHQWDSFEDVDRKPTWVCATAAEENRLAADENRRGRASPAQPPWHHPERLAIDDLLELAAHAKTAMVDLTAKEGYQLGEGVEILASDLDEERKQRAAEQAAREQVAQETAAETVRLCGLIDELRYELRERRSRVADLERRITAANDQAERDLDSHARSHRSPPRDNAAYELPDAELAGFVAAAREEEEATGIVHPLAVIADRIELLHARSERYPEDPARQVRLVRLADFEALMAAIARR